MERFDPTEFGFRRLDTSYQSLDFFERDLGADVELKPFRLNVHLTQDGEFVTIWSGLFDPGLDEDAIGWKAPEGFSFAEQYNQDLFRGFIATKEEAEVILAALRLENYSPAYLHVDETGTLHCDPLKASA